MITFTGSLATTIESDTLTLARVVSVALQNGTTYYFTELDFDRTFDGATYPAQNSCTVSQLQTILGTNTQAVSVDIILNDAGINSALIDAGALDDARVSIFLIDWNTSPVSGQLLWSGYVDQVGYKDGLSATLDCQPLIDRDVTLALDSYCMNCRADLGDAKCKFPIAELSKTGTASAYTNLQTFATSNTDINGKWNDGLISFTSGENAGFSFEIQSSTSDGTLVLKLLTPFPVAPGDAFTLYPGCDKTPATCNDVYNNIANFRGEPFTVAPWTATTANPAPPPNLPTPNPIATVPAPAFQWQGFPNSVAV